MGSQVALKTDTGKADPAAVWAGEPAVFWCHVLVVALVSKLPAASHAVVPLPLVVPRSGVALGAPCVSVDCRGLKARRVNIELLEKRGF